MSNKPLAYRRALNLRIEDEILGPSTPFALSKTICITSVEYDASVSSIVTVAFERKSSISGEVKTKGVLKFFFDDLVPIFDCEGFR